MSHKLEQEWSLNNMSDHKDSQKAYMDALGYGKSEGLIHMDENPNANAWENFNKVRASQCVTEHRANEIARNLVEKIYYDRGYDVCWEHWCAYKGEPNRLGITEDGLIHICGEIIPKPISRGTRGIAGSMVHSLFDKYEEYLTDEQLLELTADGKKVDINCLSREQMKYLLLRYGIDAVTQERFVDKNSPITGRYTKEICSTKEAESKELARSTAQELRSRGLMHIDDLGTAQLRRLLMENGIHAVSEDYAIKTDEPHRHGNGRFG